LGALNWQKQKGAAKNTDLLPTELGDEIRLPITQAPFVAASLWATPKPMLLAKFIRGNKEGHICTNERRASRYTFCLIGMVTISDLRMVITICQYHFPYQLA
jgi:hypothetical protein